MTGEVIMSMVLKGILFALLAVGMYLLVKAIREYSPLQKIREKVDEIDRQRLLGT